MSRRLQKIRGMWPANRLLSLPGSPSNIHPARIFSAVVDADPTPNHKYVAWTLKAWERGTFKWEDIRLGSDSRIADQLSRFESNKHRIADPAMRSLMKYRSPGELDAAMDEAGVAREIGFFDMSSNQQKKAMMIKARLESQNFTSNSGVQFDTPLTQYASHILGRNTRWCTAAIEDNQFADYAENGPLIIITLPDGRRFQTHCNLIEMLDYSELSEVIDSFDEDGEPFKPIDVLESVVMTREFVILNENDDVLTDEDREAVRPYQEEIADYLAKTYSRLYASYIERAVEYEEYQTAYTELVRKTVLESLAPCADLGKTKKKGEFQESMLLARDDVEKETREMFKIFMAENQDILEVAPSLIKTKQPQSTDFDWKSVVEKMEAYHLNQNLFSKFDGLVVQFRAGQINAKTIRNVVAPLYTESRLLNLGMHIQFRLTADNAVSLFQNVPPDILRDMEKSLDLSSLKGDDETLKKVLDILVSREDIPREFVFQYLNPVFFNMSLDGILNIRKEPERYSSLTYTLEKHIVGKCHSISQVMDVLDIGDDINARYDALSKITHSGSLNGLGYPSHSFDDDDRRFVEKIHRDYALLNACRRYPELELNPETEKYIMSHHHYSCNILGSEQDYISNIVTYALKEGHPLNPMALEDLSFEISQRRYLFSKEFLNKLSYQDKETLYAMGAPIPGEGIKGLPVSGEFVVTSYESFGGYRDGEPTPAQRLSPLLGLLGEKSMQSLKDGILTEDIIKEGRDRIESILARQKELEAEGNRRWLVVGRVTNIHATTIDMKDVLKGLDKEVERLREEGMIEKLKAEKMEIKVG